MLNRLPTKDRLLAWGLQVDGCCCFFHSEMETRNHLFFECNYSKTVWKEVLSLCSLQRSPRQWNFELQWPVLKLRGKALISIVLWLAWGAFFYWIWRKWNCRIFGNTRLSEKVILEKIKDAVLMSLSGTRIRSDEIVNNRICIAWGIEWFYCIAFVYIGISYVVLL